MFAVTFICGNLFLRIAGKISKIRIRKNFVPHGKTQSVDVLRLHNYNQRYFSSPWPAKSYNYAKKQTNKNRQCISFYISAPSKLQSNIALRPPFIRILFRPSSFFSPFSVACESIRMLSQATFSVVVDRPKFLTFSKKKKSNDVVKPFFS